jgi:hypothetical protein
MKGERKVTGKPKKSDPEIKVVLNLTEGREKRVAEAAYNLYLRLENPKRGE